MSNFTIGQLVELKSGGPTMTVTITSQNSMSGRVVCTWFCVVNQKFLEHEFPPESLTVAS